MTAGAWRGTGVKSTWYKADVTGVLAPAAILGAVRLFVLLNTKGCEVVTLPTPPLTQQQSIDNKLGLMLG